MICELWACLNISVSSTVGMRLKSIKSCRTEPGPTEGSWSVSPTNKSPQCSGRASSSCANKRMSSIDVSSIMQYSMRSGLLRLCTKALVTGSTPSARWMVLACMPVDSHNLFAARPVGAIMPSRHWLRDRMCETVLTKVVFPTPGPPVKMHILLVNIVLSALSCELDSL